MEHTETVVDKGVAYVKDILSLLANREATPVARRSVPERDLTSDDALRLDDPHAYIFNKSWNAHDNRAKSNRRYHGHRTREYRSRRAHGCC